MATFRLMMLSSAKSTFTVLGKVIWLMLLELLLWSDFRNSGVEQCLPHHLTFSHCTGGQTLLNCTHL